MSRVELLSAAYSGRSVIASGQECVNLYAEFNTPADPQAPARVTYYPTPGSEVYAENTEYLFPSRGAYRTSRGTAYHVVGQNVYSVAGDGTEVVIGIIANRPSMVKMKDNGLVVVLVDGVNGYVIDMTTNSFRTIIDPNFYGADFVELLDTFFIFNRPNTNQFYISASNASFSMITSSGIAGGSVTSAGTGYTDGGYNNVPLTGGSGSGARATVNVSGGVVTSVTLTQSGVGYILGNTLSVSIGPGSGFVWTVTAMQSAFDPLDIAAKSGFNDPIVGIASIHRELWLIGNLTSEVWIGTGAADFYFQQQQGAYINHGCGARYSIATIDTIVFFLMQDAQGNGIVVMGGNYETKEISTPRTVKEFKSYLTLEDAIGFCFQIGDHAFYALVFPTASKGWLYDLTSKQWSEWNWCDENGNLLRPRGNCCMFAFSKILVGDWENGKLLELSLDLYKDEDSPIVWIRTFPHITSNNQKVTYNSFDLDIEVGTISDQEETPEVSLSWSDDKGVSYSNPLLKSIGRTGETLTSPSWNRLGQARDRVFKVSSSANAQTAINGAFINFKKASH